MPKPANSENCIHPEGPCQGLRSKKPVTKGQTTAKQPETQGPSAQIAQQQLAPAQPQLQEAPEPQQAETEDSMADLLLVERFSGKGNVNAKRWVCRLDEYALAKNLDEDRR